MTTTMELIAQIAVWVIFLGVIIYVCLKVFEKVTEAIKDTRKRQKESTLGKALNRAILKHKRRNQK